MKLTMKEIAKLANVSQPTVSRVINGNDKVNPEIRKRVLRVIESVGFQPNKAAQTLKNQNSFIIGVSVTSISNPYFMDLIESIELEARKIGYNILIHNCENNYLIEKSNLQNFIARQVDGAIVVAEAEENLEILKTFKVPTVVITQDSDSFNSVSVSHDKGGALAANEFLREGITNYIYVGQGKLGKDRKLNGFRGEFYKNGISFFDDDYIHSPSEENNSLDMAKEIENYVVSRILPLKVKPRLGVFCGNDIIALQFITIAQKYGLRIDEDYLVIGFDDTLLSKSYGFSSIRQPIKDMSISSIKLLLDVINDRIKTNHNIILDPILVRRKKA